MPCFVYTTCTRMCFVFRLCFVKNWELNKRSVSTRAWNQIDNRNWRVNEIDIFNNDLNIAVVHVCARAKPICLNICSTHMCVYLSISSSTFAIALFSMLQHLFKCKEPFGMFILILTTHHLFSLSVDTISNCVKML